ncbi:MAG: efflux RND transporter periplasmic adaptor subunit [Candidatus Marinimicrobia bacterium]|nr:efflux RND transporter periplasmic adaptor subunit [Candidatus Neomarinimicrobiota bacterium]
MKTGWMNKILTLTGVMILISCGGGETVEQKVESKVAVAVDTFNYQQFQIEYHSIGRVLSENQVNLLFQSSGQVDSIWVNVGDFVNKNQKLASLENNVYQTMYTQARSMYEKSKRDLASSKDLYESNVISSDQYEMARIGLDNARAGYTQAKNTLENTVLRAPFSGWIVSKNLNVGDLASPAGAMQPPFVLADMRRLKITIPVPEAQIGQIRVGQAATVSFKTFPNRIFPGEVLRVGLAPKDFSNNYDVEVRLTGDTADLKLGLVADVRIILENFDNAIVLPLNLIQDDGTDQFVFIAEDGRAVRKPVKIKALAGARVMVEAEIEEGESLIMRGYNDVRDGSLLNIIE